MTGRPGDTVATIILAAGSGRRFGGSKLTEELGGMPVLERVLRTAAVLPGSRMIVVVGPYRRELTPILSRHPHLLVAENPDHRSGLASSLRCGLSAARSLVPAADTALVLLGDEPSVPAEALPAVTARARTSGRPTRARYHGGPGHPVALPRASWEAIESGVHGDAGAQDVLRTLGVEDVALDHHRPQDIDHPDDLTRMRRLLDSSATAADDHSDHRRRPPPWWSGSRL